VRQSAINNIMHSTNSLILTNGRLIVGGKKKTSSALRAASPEEKQLGFRPPPMVGVLWRTSSQSLLLWRSCPKG
jgi:hypothetical protein